MCLNACFRLGAASQVGPHDVGIRRYLTLGDVPGAWPQAAIRPYLVSGS